MIICRQTALSRLLSGELTKAEIRAAKAFTGETVEDWEAAEQAPELIICDTTKLNIDLCMYLMDKLKEKENEKQKRRQ